MANQEGLPAYWGIETFPRLPMSAIPRWRIRKDYPLTGVLKLEQDGCNSGQNQGLIRKDYPLTGVLKPDTSVSLAAPPGADQEGLPAYWGIETIECQ